MASGLAAAAADGGSGYSGRRSTLPRTEAGAASVPAAPSDSRFSPSSSFQYNVRVGLALLPCSCFLLGLGGKPVLSTLTLGLMISYILDSLHLKHGAFFGIWGSCFATVGALLLSGTSISTASTPLYLLALFVSFQLVFLVGVWASLQFKWLQLENPSVVLLLERLLFACIPFTASAVYTWAMVLSVGIANAAFYLMLILCAMYWMFSLPQPSSFRTKLERNYGGHIAQEALISGPLEAAFHALFLVFLPLLFHVGVHHRRLFVTPNAICDLLLLFFVPLLFQLYASSRGGLWWLVKDSADLRRLQLVNAAISLLVVLLCLEVRVVFYSFGQYIHLPPPWNYLLVTTAIVGAAAAIGLFVTRMLSDEIAPFILASLSVTAAVSGSLVLGMPFMFLPIPAIAAIFFSQFCVRKTMLPYFLFIASASFSVVWFMVHNFWSLNIWLGGLKLKAICKMIIASAVLAMVVPGLVRLPRKVRRLLELGLVAHAVLVCHLENRLYNYGSIYHFGFEEDAVYPSYLVVLSTMIGLLLTWQMAKEGLLGSMASWVLTSLYLAKLSLLVLSTKDVLWPSAVLILAVSPPVLLYRGRGKGGSKMKYWQGLGHAGVVFVTVWMCRHMIYECIHWWTGRQPTDALVWGFLTLISGLGTTPIVIYHFPHVQVAKKWLLLILSLGVLLIFLQPPVPGSLSFWWNRILYDHGDDRSIYETELSSSSWPAWLLVWIVLLSLAALTSVLPVQHIVELRVMYALVVGLSAGSYLCVEYFSKAVIIHAPLIAAVLCATLFLVFSHFPSASSPRYLPWVFLSFVVLLPVMYVVEGQLQTGVASNDDDDGENDNVLSAMTIKGAQTGILGLYAALLMLISLEIKLRLALLVRETGLHKAAAQGSVFSGSGFGPKRLLQRRHQGTLGGSVTVRQLPAEGAWMPAIGNMATILCFVICLVLNFHLTRGSDKAIFLLAPILLLLNQDVNVFSGFGDKQRYFPVALAVSVYLGGSAAHSLWQEAWHGSQNAVWGLETGSPGLFYVLKNGILLLLVIPNHVMFNRFMWDYGRQSDFLLLTTTPLNLPAAIITDITTVRLLAVMGLGYSLLQYFVAWRIRIAGMKLI